MSTMHTYFVIPKISIVNNLKMIRFIIACRFYIIRHFEHSGAIRIKF